MTEDHKGLPYPLIRKGLLRLSAIATSPESLLIHLAIAIAFSCPFSYYSQTTISKLGAERYWDRLHENK